MRHPIACLMLLVPLACSPMPATPPPAPPDPIEILLQAGRSPDPLLRANAIEALAPAPQQQADALKFGLVDANEGVRFVAAMSLGDGEHCDLVDLVRPLQTDPSMSVRAAALYALSTCQESVKLELLAKMMLGPIPHPDPTPQWCWAVLATSLPWVC